MPIPELLKHAGGWKHIIALDAPVSLSLSVCPFIRQSGSCITFSKWDQLRNSIAAYGIVTRIIAFALPIMAVRMAS